MQGGCQGVLLLKKQARRPRGPHPSARRSARPAHGRGPSCPRAGGADRGPEGQALSQATRRARGVGGTWLRCPRPGCRCSSRLSSSVLRAAPAVAEGSCSFLQRRCGWRPALRARPWASCVLSGVFPGLCGDGGSFLGGLVTSRTQRSHGRGAFCHGPHSPMENQVGPRNSAFPRRRKDGLPLGWTFAVCLVISSGVALLFGIWS